MPSNEQELCERVVRTIENEFGVARSEVSYPENDKSAPPVEMRVVVGEHPFAIEHTLIEPFEAAIQTGKHFVELTNAIVEDLDGTMPGAGTYRLYFPENPTDGRHRRTHAALRAKIVAWVRDAAAELAAAAPERGPRPFHFDRSLETEIDGLPLRLQRYADWSEDGHHDGRLFHYRLLAGDGDVESRRLPRIERALDDKFPKLKACAELGDLTVLILEWNDIVLSNEIAIAEALETALAMRNFCPDYIFIAGTCIDEEWHLHQPVIGGVFDIYMPRTDIRRAVSSQ
ncbi:MAG TPA: hypothetical protein VF718_08525 [Allosphingosinicella sp.]|jgi:hypothetical protein